MQKNGNKLLRAITLPNSIKQKIENHKFCLHKSTFFVDVKTILFIIAVEKAEKSAINRQTVAYGERKKTNSPQSFHSPTTLNRGGWIKYAGYFHLFFLCHTRSLEVYANCRQESDFNVCIFFLFSLFCMPFKSLHFNFVHV